MSTRFSNSRSLSRFRSRSRYLDEGSPLVTADLDGVGLTRCGSPRDRDGCGVGGDLAELFFRYLTGDPLSGERRLSATSGARFGTEVGCGSVSVCKPGEHIASDQPTALRCGVCGNLGLGGRGGIGAVDRDTFIRC